MRGALLVGSIGLAVHLVLPQIPGIERSLRLIADTSHLLVGVAFLSELASELCYSELLGRAVGAIGRRLKLWFMLRLTVTGYGAAHVLPGGGAASATVTYEAFRHRGFDPVRVGTALAAVSVLVYGALGTIFSGSLLYMILTRNLSPVETAASALFLVLVCAVALGAYTAHRSPGFSKRMVQRGVRMAGRLLGGTERQQKVETRSIQLVSRLGEVLHDASQHLARRRAEVPKLGARRWATGPSMPCA